MDSGGVIEPQMEPLRYQETSQNSKPHIGAGDAAAVDIFSLYLRDSYRQNSEAEETPLSFLTSSFQVGHLQERLT